MENINNKIINKNSGSALVYSVLVIFIFSLVLLGVLAFAAIQLRVIRSAMNREMAFQIAEAGVNYYQWHLAHFETDYWDGHASTTPGPYVHDYIDKDTNKKVGEFSLTITPPLVGSTVVTIKSTGYTVGSPSQKRTVTVRYGIPSLAKFAFLTHKDVWIGEDETVSGMLHSNGGVRFDGTGNAPITSAKNDYPNPGPGYECLPIHGCSPTTTKPGIWGAAPASTKTYWKMSVSNIVFTSITSDFDKLEGLASGQADLGPSNSQGYSLVFNSDGTVTIYKVTTLIEHDRGKDVEGVWHYENLDYDPAGRALVYTIPIPANGVIFVNDNVWVEGVVNGRVVVAATKFSTDPAQQARILIPNNITYLAKDGNHSLGLIAEKDILITYNSPNNLEIDAALIAQNGSAQRYMFASNTKNSIIIYGTVASFGVWTWTWVSGSTCVSGYCNTTTVYDSNLLYSPPPSFPSSTDGYQMISWSSD